MKTRLLTLFITAALTSWVFAQTPSLLLDWQPAALHGDQHRLKTRFRVQSPASPTDALKVTLTGLPGQQYVLCAQKALADRHSVIVTVDPDPVHHLITSDHQSAVQLIRPQPCPPYLANQYRYDSQQFLLSDAPYLARFRTEGEDDEDEERNDEDRSLDTVPLSGLPLDLPPEERTRLQGGGAWGPNDNPFFKPRPPFMPGLGSDLSLTLLPILRWPSDWQTVLPGTHWWHWLVGEADPDSGVTLLLSFNGEPPTPIVLTPAEYSDLSRHLGSTAQILSWLAPKLSGRQAFIDTLLSLTDTLTLDEATQTAIEQQLTAILDWPDATFSLDFELQQLDAALTEASGPNTDTLYTDETVNAHIVQAPGNQPEKTQGSGGGTARQRHSSQRASTTTQSSGPPQASRPRRQDREQDGRPPQPPVPVQAETGQARGPAGVVITFVGKTRAGKSTLANCLLGNRNFFPETTAINQHDEKDFVFNGVRIRSLPGYGRPRTSRMKGINHMTLLDDYQVENDSIVVFVYEASICDRDQDVIEQLIKKGCRCLFVRSKWDSAERGVRSMYPGQTERFIQSKITTKKKQLFDETLDTLQCCQGADGFVDAANIVFFGAAKEEGAPETLRGHIQRLLSPQEQRVWQRFIEELKSQSLYVRLSLLNIDDPEQYRETVEKELQGACQSLPLDNPTLKTQIDRIVKDPSPENLAAFYQQVQQLDETIRCGEGACEQGGRLGGALVGILIANTLSPSTMVFIPLAAGGGYAASLAGRALVQKLLEADSTRSGLETIGGLALLIKHSVQASAPAGKP